MYYPPMWNKPGDTSIDINSNMVMHLPSLQVSINKTLT